ncbi:pseudouridine kinase-like [Syzygium oleosum]|uniref:pseudouridine kinase-like n=1 Tax=Syzygium oleosum TaxID=219896 RepID=UPI0024BA5444|nr:pseudouridine kinase-like [Syzygium oleosum]
MKIVPRAKQLCLRDGREAVIIGGMVLDIHALPLSPPAPGTLTPGKDDVQEDEQPYTLAAGRAKRQIKPPQRYGFTDWVAYALIIAKDVGDLDKKEIFNLLCFIPSGFAVSWRAILWDTTVLSTTEAKYMAAMKEAKEALWLKRVITELGMKQEGASVIFCDNQSAIQLTKNLYEVLKLSNFKAGILQTQDITTAVVCCVLDPNGEVAAGVASFESIEKFLTAEWIQQFRYKISSAPVVMVDANLNDCALEASCQLAAGDNIPLRFEPVSVAKSKKIAPLVKYVTYVSPNEDELFAMADALSPGKLYCSSESYKSEKNCPPESLIKMLKPAIILLLEKGVKIVVVTIGARGVFLCSKEGSILTRTVVEKPQTLGVSSELHRLISPNCLSHKFHDARQIEGTSHLFALHLPGLPASVKKLTGAGDCLVGATLASICEGLNIIQAISVGIAAAKATVKADSNVPLTFDLIGVADDARLVYSAAKVVYDGPL